MEEDVVLRATGVNSEVELLEGVVRIRRRKILGFLSQASKSEKDILISEISCIEFRKAGLFSDGYIHFTYEGGGRKGSRDDLKGDDSAVFFRGGQQKAFEALRQAVEEAMAWRRRGIGFRSGASTDPDELEKLVSLRDRGALTEEEFNLKKRQILNL